MTPEDYASLILDPNGNVGSRLRQHLAPPLLEDLGQAIAAAVRKAVAEENEACARIALARGNLIRARGKENQ